MRVRLFPDEVDELELVAIEEVVTIEVEDEDEDDEEDDEDDEDACDCVMLDVLETEDALAEVLVDAVP